MSAYAGGLAVLFLAGAGLAVAWRAVVVRLAERRPSRGTRALREEATWARWLPGFLVVVGVVCGAVWLVGLVS